MAVKIRLMRMGKRKQPTYRVVVADSRSPRDGRFIELIGRYDPRAEPSVVEIDNDRALDWLQKGAQPSDQVRRLLEISGAWARFKVASGDIHTVPAEAAAPAAPVEPAEAEGAMPKEIHVVGGDEPAPSGETGDAETGVVAADVAVETDEDAPAPEGEAAETDTVGSADATNTDEASEDEEEA